MNYVFRKMRKSEPMKVNRILMKNGYIYRKGLDYYLVTTDNPKKKKNRLIVAVIGVNRRDEVIQMSVAPAYKWTDVLAFGMKNVRTEYVARSIALKLRPEHLYAVVTGGWYMESYKKGVWSFLRTIPPIRHRKTNKWMSKLSNILIKETGGGITYKPKEVPKPYVIGERVASLWEFIRTDPEYRAFKDWKPRIKILTWNLLDVVPWNTRFKMDIKPADAEYRTLYAIATYRLGRDVTNNMKYEEFRPFVKWVDDKGVRGTKRIQKYMYDKYNHKLDDSEMERLNRHYRDSGAMGIPLEFEFTRKIDWRRGDFGDESSCWLYPKEKNYDHHCHFSAALNSCGYGVVVKVYRDGKGIGRVFGSVENGHLFLFNYRMGTNVVKAHDLYSRIAEVLDLKYESASLDAEDDKDSGRTYIYIENPFACISRNPVSRYTLQWYKEGDKDTKHYVPN